MRAIALTAPQFPRFDRSFDNLNRLGFIDLTSGAWDRRTNVRKAHCGRCGVAIPKGTGKPYIQLHADFYRMTDKYLCPSCNVLVRP